MKAQFLQQSLTALDTAVRLRALPCRVLRRLSPNQGIHKGGISISATRRILIAVLAVTIAGFAVAVFILARALSKIEWERPEWHGVDDVY